MCGYRDRHRYPDISTDIHRDILGSSMSSQCVCQERSIGEKEDLRHRKKSRYTREENKVKREQRRTRPGLL